MGRPPSPLRSTHSPSAVRPPKRTPRLSGLAQRHLAIGRRHPRILVRHQPVAMSNSTYSGESPSVASVSSPVRSASALPHNSLTRFASAAHTGADANHNPRLSAPDLEDLCQVRCLRHRPRRAAFQHQAEPLRIPRRLGNRSSEPASNSVRNASVFTPTPIRRHVRTSCHAPTAASNITRLCLHLARFVAEFDVAPARAEQSPHPQSRPRTPRHVGQDVRQCDVHIIFGDVPCLVIHVALGCARPPSRVVRSAASDSQSRESR